MKNKSLATCYSVIFVLVITGIILSLLECDKAQYDVDKQLLLPSEVTYKMLWWQRNTGKFTFYQSDDCWAFDKKSCCQKMDINFDKSTISAQKRPLIIALLDTGIDIQHQALQNNIFYNSQEIPNDNLDNDNNGFIDDLHGWNFLDNNANVNSAYDSNNPCSFHGTHIAGIISASENSCAMSGLLSNYNVKLLCVKILDDELNGTLENLKKAIIYSEKMGASICCLSIGTDTYDSDLRNLMCKSKMLFVTAAGNGFIDIDKNPFYPASYKLNNQISVASIRCDGRLSATSNYGKDTIDVAAPGTDIISSIPGNHYCFLCGTSCSVPIVASAAGLIYIISNQKYSAEQIKKIVIQNSKTNKYLNGKIRNSKLIDIDAAIEHVIDTCE